ncbi:fibronectin type III domain-containing protein, partial [Candidatus Micrarchaeota archaeon]|nr:fibronectin type III domain-containing protein [Candidatus Micrarchaeota archaeon]MBU1930109.1 fibronectin type III domain-containing protein [Candidatus Micrarchaeota archaeon]
MTVKKWGIGILLLLVFISTVVAVTTVTLEMAEYTNSSAPSMSITATEPGINPKMSFSCNGTDFSGEIGFVSPYEEFDITNPTFGCTSDEGSKTVYAKVTDDETPEGVTESDTIIYDITAPTTDYAIDPTDPNGADDWYIETAPTITLTCTDALSGCQINYEWNSEGEQTVASPLVLTAIEGDNTFSYYATDGAGNDETLQGPVTLNVDSFADFTALTINDGDTHTNNTTDVDLALDGTVGDFTGTPCLITVDGTPDQNVAFQTTITNYPWTPGDDNEKTIMVACTDIHGNVQEQFDTIILDTAPPDINSFELKGGADYANAEDETTITINVEGSADLAECHFGMEETSLGEYLAYSSSGMDFAWDTNSGNGEYTVYGECRDSVGYVSTPVQSDSITLDVTAPEVPVLSGAPFGPTGIKLNWSEVVDNGPSGLLEFDVVGYATGLGTGTREYLVEDLASGTSYTFRLIARDNAGNESLSDEVTVTTNPVDNQPANNPPANNPSANVPAAIPNGPNWLNPIEGATVSGTTTLQVEITSSASTASKVAFYLDGYATTDQIEQVNKGSSSIIELEWDSTTVEDG